jgi:hypothetical protein
MRRIIGPPVNSEAAGRIVDKDIYQAVEIYQTAFIVFCAGGYLHVSIFVIYQHLIDHHSPGDSIDI